MSSEGTGGPGPEPDAVPTVAEIASGMTTREAAEALFVSPKTIEFHLTKVYRKLGVGSRAALARLLLDRG